MFGGSLTLLATLGVILSSSLAALLAAATLFGAGEVVTAAAGAALLAESTREDTRTRTFGLSFAAVSAAYFIANVIGGRAAAPLAAALGRGEHDVLVLRMLLASAAVIGASSSIPILLLGSRERPPHVDAPRSWSVLARFALVNTCFGFGAGSFLPYLNLFFAERFGLDFASVGIALGAVNIAGGLGGIVHTNLVPRLGLARALVVFWSASLPLAIAGGFAPSVAIAVAALVGRGVLMSAAVPAMDAFTISAFRPQERTGAQAVITTMWLIAYGAGAFVSGLVRSALGDPGFTVNLLTLAASYVLAIVSFALAFGRSR